MEWQIKYDVRASMTPWSVYKVFDRDFILEERFTTEMEALVWVRKKEREEVFLEVTKPNSLPPVPFQPFSFKDFPVQMRSLAGSLRQGAVGN